jgi:hypothetical protein
MAGRKTRLFRNLSLCHLGLMTHLASLGGAVTVALVLGASAAVAHHRPVIVNNQRVAEDPTQKCECRARGKAFTVGEQICLNGRVATCAMDQNVTSWRPTSDACPNALNFTPVRRAERSLPHWRGSAA